MALAGQAAIAPIRPLAREPPYAVEQTARQKKKKKKEEGNSLQSTELFGQNNYVEFCYIKRENVGDTPQSFF